MTCLADSHVGEKMISTIRLAMFGFCLLALTACYGEPDILINNNHINTPLPEKIRQIAQLGTAALEVRVSVNDDEVRQVRVSNDVAADEIVSIPVNVPADQRNNIEVRWLAVVGNTRILLADFETITEANQQTLTVAGYNDTGDRFDFDGDGLSNLQEVRENRNPLDEFDLEVPHRTTFLGASIELIQGAVDPDTSGDTREQDANSTFSLRHDGTNLVLYLCGQDEELQGDSTLANDQYWHDDTIFLYLDGANSDDSQFDDFDDFQIAFIRSTEEMRVPQGQNNTFCPQGTCITFEFDPPGSLNTQCEYELFVRAPFAELNMTRGTAVGFDLEITDDDNGGLREGSSGFVGFDDRSDLDPSTFGTIILE